MKNSKAFLLLALVTVLIIAVSACAVIPSQSSESGYNGTTVIATVKEIDGDRLTLSIQTNVSYTPLGSAVSYATFNGSFDGIFYGSYDYSFVTMSVQGNASPSYSYVYDFSGMSLATNLSVQYSSPVVTLKTFTVAPEMLAGISVGDIVDVTFDENENVIKIEKRTVISSTADGGDGETDASQATAQKESEK